MAKGLKNFDKVIRTGGDAPTGQGPISSGVPAGRVCVGFLIVEDGEFDYTTEDADVITDVSGTWALNVQHSQRIASVQNTTNASGKLFFLGAS